MPKRKSNLLITRNAIHNILTLSQQTLNGRLLLVITCGQKVI